MIALAHNACTLSLLLMLWPYQLKVRSKYGAAILCSPAEGQRGETRAGVRPRAVPKSWKRNENSDGGCAVMDLRSYCKMSEDDSCILSNA